jgi:hypothetical protein
MDPSFWVQKGTYRGILGEGWLLINKILSFETETRGNAFSLNTTAYWRVSGSRGGTHEKGKIRN